MKFVLFRRRSALGRFVLRFCAVASISGAFFACGDDPPQDSGNPPDDPGTGGMSPGGAGGDDGAGPTCGDGRRTGAEECDDANGDSGDGCDERCRIEPSAPACGDGDPGGEEDCDDGNLQSGDGCDDRCRDERCGNRRIDAGEECDPPASGACTASCVRYGANCGDGAVQEDEGEECDDDNDDPEDGCHDCRHQCGNGRIDRALGEDCEPSLSSPDRCSEECKWLPVCGDGEVQPSVGEECDPSNGVTCVGCRIDEPDPPCPGGAGGASSTGGGGCGGSGGAGECVPQGSSELVQNGRFDTNSTGWAPHSSSVTLSTVDEGSPNPNALEVLFRASPVRAISGAYQCLPVRPDRLYELTAQYRIPAESPQGVGASVTALLYAGTRCEGSFVAPAGSGPEGRVRDVWTPYQYTVNTAALPDGVSEGRLLLRLGVVRSANVEGSRVLWDSVSLSEPGSLCGNCSVDDGETCDDGNQAPGDSCSPTCRRENCGDGVRESSEACDDGNTVFGGATDQCTPSCRLPSTCDTCSANECGSEVEACLGLTGVAQAGRRAGTPLSVLCDELRSCVYASACHLATRTTVGVEGEFLENCYCGTSGARCFDTPGRANGSCRAEVEAALETVNPTALLGRLGGSNASYPVFSALRDLLACEDNAACATACVHSATCGDGQLQDRNLDFTFVVDRQEVECSDELTHTGRGCSFEECDDDNLDPGDGCDENCFLEACGNYVTQAGEECDDGNRASGDGCSAECQAEFECGNSMVEEPFEECDPPGGDRVCTEAEYTSNPSQCGCDAQCSRIVCGNEIAQRPAEECDPPNGFSCGADCRLLDQGACETCISAHPELGPVNELYCNVEATCVTVKQCVIAEECFAPVPAACYCGELVDYAACEEAAFIPMGACRDAIVAGVGGTGLDNATVLGRLFDFTYPAGVAMQILDESSRVGCVNECFPP